jgi:hypothetical protein
LTVGGLIKHVAGVERNWIDMMLERERPASADDDYVRGFTMRPDEILADVLAYARGVGDETERVVRAIPDLGQRVPCRRACRGTPTTSTPGRYGGC